MSKCLLTFSLEYINHRAFTENTNASAQTPDFSQHGDRRRMNQRKLEEKNLFQVSLRGKQELCMFFSVYYSHNALQ